MRSCINARFRKHRDRCNPQACGDYVPAPTSVALVALLVLLCGCVAADAAVSLSISGPSSGHGLHILSFSGEQINASIMQGNNSTWLINATGAA